MKGNWEQDLPGAAGSAASWQGTSSEPFGVEPTGLILLNGARAPAKWRFTWVSGADGACAQKGATADVNVNEEIGFVCHYIEGVIVAGNASAPVISPNPVFSFSPPTNATVTGNGFSSSYGMPMVQYYSMDGTLVAQETATSVSSDGTSMLVSAFNASTLLPGTYVGFINNAGPNSTWQYVGTGAVQVFTPGVTIVGSVQNQTSGDGGQVSVTVNGFTKTATYANSDTPSTIISNLTTAINSDSTSPVTATNANALWLSAKSASTSSPTVSVSSQSYAYPPKPEMESFLAIPLEAATGTGSLTIIGSEQTGGQHLYYDTGQVSVTANGFALSASYGAQDTTSTIASSLANAFNSNSTSPVTASGNVLSITSKSGSSTKLMIWASSQTAGYPDFYGVPSFVPAPSQTRTGTGDLTIVGSERTGNRGNSDTGTISVTVNGFTKTARYSTNDTPSTVASNLASAFNSDSASPVTASTTGSNLSITSKSGSSSILTISGSSQSDAYPFILGVPSFIPMPDSGQ